MGPKLAVVSCRDKVLYSANIKKHLIGRVTQRRVNRVEDCRVRQDSGGCPDKTQSAKMP